MVNQHEFNYQEKKCKRSLIDIFLANIQYCVLHSEINIILEKAKFLERFDEAVNFFLHFV